MKTKKPLARLLLVVTLCYFWSFNALALDNKSTQTKHEPITQQLMILVEHSSEVKRMLVKSIEIAKRINVEEHVI